MLSRFWQLIGRSLGSPNRDDKREVREIERQRYATLESWRAEDHNRVALA